MFSGTLPSEIENLDLTRLQIQDNMFIGTIPPGLFNSLNLRELRLDNNQFGGSVSSLIGSLSRLRDLRLNQNNFSGELPIEFAALTNLGMWNDLAFLNIFNQLTESPTLFIIQKFLL